MPERSYDGNGECAAAAAGDVMKEVTPPRGDLRKVALQQPYAEGQLLRGINGVVAAAAAVGAVAVVVATVLRLGDDVKVVMYYSIDWWLRRGHSYSPIFYYPPGIGLTRGCCCSVRSCCLTFATKQDAAATADRKMTMLTSNLKTIDRQVLQHRCTTAVVRLKASRYRADWTQTGNLLLIWQVDYSFAKLVQIC